MAWSIPLSSHRARAAAILALTLGMATPVAAATPAAASGSMMPGPVSAAVQPDADDGAQGAVQSERDPGAPDPTVPGPAVPDPAVPDPVAPDPAAPDPVTPSDDVEAPANMTQPDAADSDRARSGEQQTTSVPPQVGTWIHDSKGWRYKKADGTFVTNEVQEIDGVRYAFNSSGYIPVGWYKDPAGRWFLSSEMGVRTGWHKVTGSWYFMGSDGVMKTGWLQDGGAWYYLLDTGSMVTGWQRVGSTWYHFSASGARISSAWIASGGYWYYLGSDGAMATDWCQIGGSWYYFSVSGAMALGWINTDGQWYHLGQSGAQTYGWYKDSDYHWYYLDPSRGGAMFGGGWQMLNGQWNYFDPWSGFWVTSRADFQTDWNRAKTQYSPTNYLLMVDTWAPRCMAFYWRSGGWQPLYDWECSVGAAATPTVTGSFSVGSRGPSFGQGYTAYWWTQFYGDYLFHSVLYYQGTYTIKDGRLNSHVSHGCVRMNIWDAKWIHDNVPSGTRVYIY